MLRRAIVPLALFLPLPVSATMMVAMSLHQLAGRADRIFVGRVLKAESHWSEDGRHIVTDTTFEVQQGVHGAKDGERVVVRRLGGSVNGIGMRVAGSPTFRPGETTLLFTEVRAGHRYVVGMMQGVFPVQRTEDGRITVARTLGGLSLVKRTDDGLRAAEQPKDLAARQPLDLFVQHIRRALADCATDARLCRSR
ncbi:MAG: hypothetical protein IT371_14265 [Deltaproteobacteria bacterium]|nr:hypothetical protein [Deltaproteobacteria bacterium]